MGTIVGAGIYVLMSEVARVAGASLPWAFLVAGVSAGLTGACYAELSARLPRAAGAALYVDRAFNLPALSTATGLLVLLTGVVSAATIARGFVGYLAIYIELPRWLAILGLCLAMGIITSLGIRKSTLTIAAITTLEVSGLLLVAAVAGTGAPREIEVTFHPGPVTLGAFLAFYAYIGFEDMVNLAEEVQNPRRNLPLAILLAITISGALYLLIAMVAIRFVDLNALEASVSPLALMVGDHPQVTQLVGVIAVVAVSNGAITQIIMASRMLYGMSRRALLPALFGRISPWSHTPVFNTWLVTAIIAACAISLPLVALAKITAAVMLLIFVLVNFSLIRLRSREEVTQPVFRVWTGIPILSLLVNLALLGYQLWFLLSV